MDTSTCSHGNQNALQSAAQRKFYQWVLKWINGVHAHIELNGEETSDTRYPAKPDVPVLASFLQAIGFKLLSFENHNDTFIRKKPENNVSTSEKGVLRVTIECDSSGTKAILELEGITCRCPNSDHIKDASFWSVSGTGPTASTDNIVQKVEETGSNLLPRLSKDVTRVLRDVSYKLFDTITCEPDVNRNTDISLNVSRSSNVSYEPKIAQDILKKEVGVTRSYTQPEMRIRADSLNSKLVLENREKNINSEVPVSRNPSPAHSNKSTLQRQKTWDINNETGSLDGEPRPSPPKLTSSPVMVAELSNSLGQISLHSEIEYPRNVTEYIIGAQQNLEKALKMLSIKKPMILNDLSPNQDHEIASVKSAPANISPTVVISPYKLNRTSTTSSVKPLPKINHSTYEQQFLMKTNSGNAAQTPKARRNIEATLSKSVTRKNEQENSKLAVRRSSFYIPSMANSNSSLLSKPLDVGQKLLGSGKFSTPKASESNLSNRSSITAKRIAADEQKIGISANLETLNKRTSLIKPPTKISKAIPIKIKPVQPSKINTGIAKKPRVSLSKE